MTLSPKVFKKEGKQRRGRGFSRDELKTSGLNLPEALRLGIPIDARRRTVHEENVEALKAFSGSRKPKPVKKPKN